jgi:hypothetical protein
MFSGEQTQEKGDLEMRKMSLTQNGLVCPLGAKHHNIFRVSYLLLFILVKQFLFHNHNHPQNEAINVLYPSFFLNMNDQMRVETEISESS